MKIKVSKHKFNIHYQGSSWGSQTQQLTYCLRHAHPKHIESHLGEKQPQAKIVFLFSQLHFNNVTSDALFYSGHLVMHSKRCTVQNQWITLRQPTQTVWHGVPEVKIPSDKIVRQTITLLLRYKPTFKTYRYKVTVSLLHFYVYNVYFKPTRDDLNSVEVIHYISYIQVDNVISLKLLKRK